MTDGISAEKLDQLQKRWKRADPVMSRYCSGDLQSIKNDLKKMGLDLSVDETYELIDPNLTRDLFNQRYLHAVIKETVQYFNQATVRAREDFINTYHARRAASLQHMTEHMMPIVEKAIKDSALFPDLDPLEERQLALLRTACDDGTVEDDIARHAALAAHDEFRMALEVKKGVEKADQGKLFDLQRKGLGHADSTLEFIDMAGQYYQPVQIPAKYDSFSGWDEKAGTLDFSREAAEELRQWFLIRELATKFKSALEFQQEGHFVLDASGSGHGMMVMPMQEIAQKLQKYGHDISDPATYQQIGTDIQTFRQAYQRERSEVMKNDQYKLVRAELKL